MTMVLALSLTGGSSEKYFAAGLGLTISMTFISYVVTFPSLLVLRKKLPDVPRPFRVPGGWGTATVVTMLPTLLVAFTVATLIWPGLGVGWFGTEGNPDDSLPTAFAGERLSYTLSQLIPLGVALAIGVLFVLWGRRQTKTQDLVGELLPTR
ncbi:hypothetical protein LWC34_28635 [Kibdelosporangium philippinense]|uniref:AcrB/AcrD/AcrF family protein n=1 Tax=Kibdelosporangium philippinense TaxID=211113 RepID=A0ABS8ZG17_9PSEU|nr:hypothetical protein [Kibdelosporangium philippinense]MCE7006764.1 hypothetical protein [Kibdelosporangium philippinense]